MNTPHQLNLNLNPKRIMVFPCGSEIGLEIQRALSWNKHFILIGASGSDPNHGPFVFKHYFDGLPFHNEPDFIEKVKDFVDAHAIDVIFPANDSVQLQLARHADELDCLLISPPAETCEVCRSKALTYHKLSGIVRVPQVYDRAAVVQFPVFLKPDKGQGSEGVHLARNQAELDFYISRNPDLLILENLPGEEYTVDCFTDRHGVLRGAYPRARARIKRGISVRTYPVEIPAIQTLAEHINQALDLRGGWFFQLKEASDGELVLMEIGPRIAGSMGLTRNLGVNIPLLSVYDRLDMEVGIQKLEHNLVMERALTNRFKSDLEYRHVYLDLDDTLIVDSQVNPMLMAFIIQCRNREIPVHLITRNPADIHELLRGYGLDSLFDRIIQMEPGEKKADRIIPRDAIFIDDSYQERADVAEALQIPCFDVDAVESLMDDRR